MTGRRLPRASLGVGSPAAAIVIVIVVCGSALGIVELQLSSINSGRPDVSTSTATATITTTLVSISTTTITNLTTPAQGSAQVAVTAAFLKSGDFLSGNAGVTFTCGAAAGSWLLISNTGTASTSVTMVSITWAGQTNWFWLAAGSTCSIGASGSATATQNLLFVSSKLITTATAGGNFAGSVILSNGAVLLFTGSFDGPQGSAQIAVTAASLKNGDFLSGNAGVTFTCGAAAGSFLTLSNTGTAGSTVTAATINWAGQTNSFSLATGSSCFVGASGSTTATQNLLFVSSKLLTSATAGGTFTGSVTLSNGAVLLFTGTFQ